MPRLQEVFGDPSPVALVTGSGAPRVGRAIAEHLGRLGCRLALHAHHSIREAEEAAAQYREQGVETIVVQGAMEASAEVESFVAAVIEYFGRLDILVNSAAIWEPKPLEEVTAEEVHVLVYGQVYAPSEDYNQRGRTSCPYTK
jgi:pteridine reductase